MEEGRWTGTGFFRHRELEMCERESCRIFLSWSSGWREGER